jgi:hypothetical protein
MARLLLGELVGAKQNSPAQRSVPANTAQNIGVEVSPAAAPGIGSAVVVDPLAARIYECAHLEGEFRLRSGVVSPEYFDSTALRATR